MTFITNPLGLLDTNNTSALALAIAGSFVGSWTQVEQFIGAVVILFLAGGEKAALEIDQSPNAGVNVTTTEYVLLATNSVSVTVQAEYLRVRVLANQATTVTGYVQTIVQAGSSNPPVRPLSSALLATDGAMLTRSLAVGNTGTGYIDLSVTNTGAMNVSLAQAPVGSIMHDALYRNRASAPDPVLTYYQITTGMATRDWTEISTGAGTTSTYSQDRASTTIAVAAVTAGTRVRQSVQRGIYQPGTSSIIYITATPGPCGAGITKRWGYFDDNNGLFFQAVQVAGVDHLQVVVRSHVSGAPVDTVVDQAAFNGGGFPPGFSLSNTNLYGFDFAWLGAASVRCFVFNGGQFYVLHVFLNSALTSVWTSTPNVPMRYEIINSGAGAAQSLECICASMIAERGITSIRTVPRSANRGNSFVAVPNDGLTYVLLAIRINPASLGVVVQLSMANLFCSSGVVQYLWTIQSKVVVAGAALVFTGAAESDVQVAITDATNTLTSGNLLMSGYSDTSNQSTGLQAFNLNQYALGANASGTPFIYCITVRKIDGGAADTFAAALSWYEG